MKRRTFTKLLAASAFFAWFDLYASARTKIISLKGFNIKIPPWLINPQKKQISPKIRIDALGISHEQGYLRFAGEKPFYIDPNLTPAQVLKSNKNLTDRTYMILKRTLSYSLYKKTNDIEKYQDMGTIDNMSLNDLAKILTG